MTSNERNSVKKAAANEGLHTSSYNHNTQTDGYNSVKHVGSNRTIINGDTYYGSKAAKDAIKKLR